MKKRIIAFILALGLLGILPVNAEFDFTDVNESDYFYISVMVASGTIIHGIGNNQFNPYGKLTVSEGIKLAACIHAKYNNAELKLNPDAYHWVDTYYNYAVENKIIKENDFQSADFDKAITRDKLFYIFANTFPDSEYPEINEIEFAPEKPETDYLKKLFCAGIVIGTDKGFEPDSYILRADAAEMVLRMTAYTRRRIVFADDVIQ